MTNWTHTGIVIKHGRKRLKLRKAVKNWHCENGCIFKADSGCQQNGDFMGFLEISSIKPIKAV